jgi:hypothetical protein
VLSPPSEADVLERLVAWAAASPSVRALILTSSRARTTDSADQLSDYDVIVAVRDASAFAEDDSWASEYGTPVVRWGDEHQLYGTTTYFRGVIYSNGVRIDYTVWPDALLERVSDAPELPEDSTSATAFSWTRTIEPRRGRHRRTRPISRSAPPARSTTHSWRSSGGT